MRWSVWLLSLAAASSLVFVTTNGHATAAEADAGVAFVDDREVVVSLEPGETREISFEVINGGPSEQVIVLRLVSSDEPAGATPLAATTAIGVDGVIARSGVIDLGGVWAPTMTMSGGSPAGTYTGRLAAIGGDGSYSFRDVKVTIDSIPQPSVGTNQLFTEPLPDPMTLHAERSLLAAFQDGALDRPVTLRLDPGLAGTSTVGPLIDDRGRIAYASISADGTITISSTPAAGTYKGTVGEEDSEGEPARLTTLVLTSRDFFAWPLLVLVIGLALAFLAEDWFTRRAPRQVLESRIAELKEESVKQTAKSDEELKRIDPWFGVNRLPVALWQPDPPRGLFAEARTQALADFDETPTPAKRDERWGAQGTELAKIRGYLESQTELGYLATGTNQAHRELIEALAERTTEYNASPLAVATFERLAGGLIENIGDLQTKVADRRDIAERVGKAAELAKILVRLGKKLPNRPNDVAALWRRLTDMPRGTLDEINVIAKSANDLWDEAASERFTDEALEVEMDPDNFESMSWAFQSFFGVDTGGGFADSAAIEPTAAEIRRGLWRNNLVFSTITSAFVVLAAFGTQYLTNPAFGSEADYAALFVWSFSATAVAQLLKYAASMVRFRSEPTPTIGEV